jgi:formylglycine-generating enzyme required for sulfatase activity
MHLIAGGSFLMGSEDFYPEEKPVRRTSVGRYWIDEHPVTNRQFAEFVEATGYTTVAETAPDVRDYPGMLDEMAKPGSAVFTPPPGPVPLNNPGTWWRYIFGASWRHPLGPDGGIDDIMDHPVVQIAYQDAKAYAKWARKQLPTEAEWEFAARGGLEGKNFAWGDQLVPDGRMMANYWQGQFPWQNTCDDGFFRTSPVRAFPANGYGLYDMIGNVWEWTDEWYSTETIESDKPCCGPPRARRARMAESFDPCTPDLKIPRRVLKGGSHLCAANYCQRYRPAARYAHPIDSPTSHVGFRCVLRID